MSQADEAEALRIIADAHDKLSLGKGSTLGRGHAAEKLVREFFDLGPRTGGTLKIEPNPAYTQGVSYKVTNPSRRGVVYVFTLSGVVSVSSAGDEGSREIPLMFNPVTERLETKGDETGAEARPSALAALTAAVVAELEKLPTS